MSINPNHTRRALGGAAALCGLLWVLFSAYLPISSVLSGDRDAALVIFFFVAALMAIPGYFSFVHGIRLFRTYTEESLRWVVGMFFVGATFMLSVQITVWLPELLPEALMDFFPLFLCSLIAIPAYLSVLKFLVRQISGEERTRKSLLNRGTLIMMGWLLWLLLSSLFREYAPIKEGYTHIHEEPWGLISFFGPILIACIAYWVAGALFLEDD